MSVSAGAKLLALGPQRRFTGLCTAPALRRTPSSSLQRPQNIDDFVSPHNLRRARPRSMSAMPANEGSDSRPQVTQPCNCHTAASHPRHTRNGFLNALFTFAWPQPRLVVLKNGDAHARFDWRCQEVSHVRLFCTIVAEHMPCCLARVGGRQNIRDTMAVMMAAHRSLTRDMLLHPGNQQSDLLRVGEHIPLAGIAGGLNVSFVSSRRHEWPYQRRRAGRLSGYTLAYRYGTPHTQRCP
jgi:hypothetical protein